MDLQLNEENSLITASTGDIGTPEDVANLVRFVASPIAGYINGANFRIDGGSTVSVT